MYCVTLLVIACLILSTYPQHLPTSNDYQQFKSFMTKYNKTYDSPVEFERRFNIFKANLIRIAQSNADPNDYAIYGVTKFSDLTPQEFSENLGHGRGVRGNGNEVGARPALIPSNFDQNVPDSFDWRDRGVVTSVKDQRDCQLSWAFSVVGNIEGQNAIANNYLVDLSAQQILSCNQVYMDCEYGNTQYAMNYVLGQGGLETEEDYPYVAVDGICHFRYSKVNVSLQGYEIFQPHKEDDMLIYLYNRGPLSACFNSAHLQSYESGVLNPRHCRPSILNHCGVIVGYGTDGIPYWTVKNSVGSDWGEAGYFRIARGNNTCGITEQVLNGILF